MALHQFEQFTRDRVLVTYQPDVGIRHSQVPEASQYSVNLAVCPNHPLFLDQRSCDVERPPILLGGLDPACRPNWNAVLDQSPEQLLAVVNLVLYQRDRIHRYTPSG